jgi:hypothetical protein
MFGPQNDLFLEKCLEHSLMMGLNSLLVCYLPDLINSNIFRKIVYDSNFDG